MGDNNINYYGILYKLQDYTYRLNLELIEREKERKEKNGRILYTIPIELLMNEIRGYIFSVDILKNVYTNKIKVFNDLLKTENYKNKANEAYTKLKEYTKSITPEDYKIVYSTNMYKHRKGLTGYSYGLTHPFNAYIRKKGEQIPQELRLKWIAFDKPLLYFYPSILLPELINQDYAQINCMLGMQLFYSQFILPRNYLEFPKDIEFYWSSAVLDSAGTRLIETIDMHVEFNLYFISSCLIMVLLELRRFIEDNMKKYLNNPTLPNADDSLEILREYPKLYAIWDYITVSTRIKDIMEQFNISEPTVYKRIRKITGILTGTEDGSINTLIKLKFNK